MFVSVSYYAVYKNGTHCVKIGSSTSVRMGAPQVTDVAAFYRRKLELLGILVSM